MSKTGEGDLKKAHRRENDSKIRARVLVVCMVHARKKSIYKMAAYLMQSERWVHGWLKRPILLTAPLPVPEQSAPPSPVCLVGNHTCGERA